MRKGQSSDSALGPKWIFLLLCFPCAIAAPSPWSHLCGEAWSPGCGYPLLAGDAPGSCRFASGRRLHPGDAVGGSHLLVSPHMFVVEASVCCGSVLPHVCLAQTHVGGWVRTLTAPPRRTHLGAVHRGRADSAGGVLELKRQSSRGPPQVSQTMCFNWAPGDLDILPDAWRESLSSRHILVLRVLCSLLEGRRARAVGVPKTLFFGYIPRCATATGWPPPRVSLPGLPGDTATNEVA